MNNNQFGRPYMVNYPNNFNPQITYEQQIDNEINNLQQMKERIRNNTMQQPTLNQTIQVSPTPNIGIKYVNSVEDVSRELVFTDTPFITNDFSKMFIKNAKGEIRTFEVNEVIPKDEKEVLKEQIEKLTKENELLKGMVTNESTNAVNDESVNAEFSEPVEAKTAPNVPVSRTSKGKSK